jgi:hypothetical protein
MCPHAPARRRPDRWRVAQAGPHLHRELRRRRVQQAVDGGVGFGLLGVLLQRLLQRVHGQALRRGGQLGAGVGAACSQLGHAVVALAHHIKERGRGGEFFIEVFDLPGHRRIAGGGGLAAVEQAKRGEGAHHGRVDGNAVAVLGNFLRPNAQHLVRFQHRARRLHFNAPSVHGNAAVLLQRIGLGVAHKTHAQARRGGALRNGLQRIGGGLARLVGLAVGVAPENLRKQRVGPHRRVGHQAHAGGGPLVERGRAKRAFGEQRDVGAQALLPGGQVQQFEEGALAHHHLARQRVGFRQQPLQVHKQRDLVGHGQIDQPRLQVV